MECAAKTLNKNTRTRSQSTITKKKIKSDAQKRGPPQKKEQTKAATAIPALQQRTFKRKMKQLLSSTRKNRLASCQTWAITF